MSADSIQISRLKQRVLQLEKRVKALEGEPAPTAGKKTTKKVSKKTAKKVEA